MVTESSAGSKLFCLCAFSIDYSSFSILFFFFYIYKSFFLLKQQAHSASLSSSFLLCNPTEFPFPSFVFLRRIRLPRFWSSSPIFPRASERCWWRFRMARSQSFFLDSSAVKGCHVAGHLTQKRKKSISDSGLYNI